MGCKFDSLASAWLQPACIDEELTFEFDHAGPGPNGEWHYFTDMDMTNTFTLEEVANLAETGISYWNTQAWHLAHCTFNWRKAVRSKFTGVQVEARSDTEGHVKHCEAMFKSIGPLDWVGTESVITLDADWAGMHHEEMHPLNEMHMHPSEDEMHPSSNMLMHPSGEEMHPSGNMHLHPSGETMHHEMHPSGEAMHPEMHPDISAEMHPSMHPGSEMHPSKEMHPSMHPGNEMHPSNAMHPGAEMHPSKAMHPGVEMHPSSDMHPGAAMHSGAEMHPSNAMHPGAAMHPGSEMHPSKGMHPSMHPTELVRAE